MGVLMDIHGEEPAEVAADIICLNCDRPATSKINGAAGHSHDCHPCPWCHATLLDANKIDGYNYSKCSFPFQNQSINSAPQARTRRVMSHSSSKPSDPKILQRLVRRQFLMTMEFAGLSSISSAVGCPHGRQPWISCTIFSLVRS